VGSHSVLETRSPVTSSSKRFANSSEGGASALEAMIRFNASQLLFFNASIPVRLESRMIVVDFWNSAGDSNIR